MPHDSDISDTIGVSCIQKLIASDSATNAAHNTRISSVAPLGLSFATGPTRSSVTTDELDKTSEVSVEMLADSSSTTNSPCTASGMPTTVGSVSMAGMMSSMDIAPLATRSYSVPAPSGAAILASTTRPKLPAKYAPPATISAKAVEITVARFTLPSSRMAKNLWIICGMPKTPMEVSSTLLSSHDPLP